LDPPGRRRRRRAKERRLRRIQSRQRLPGAKQRFRRRAEVPAAWIQSFRRRRLRKTEEGKRKGREEGAPAAGRWGGRREEGSLTLG